MSYNLDLFGKELKDIRESLNLTQNEISELTGINAVTLRRIEKGKVIPRFDTLEILSPIFKLDLVDLLLKYRLDDYSIFCEIENTFEAKLDSGEFQTLDNELNKLNKLLLSTNNMYYKILIKQLVIFIEAIILYKNNNYDKALNMLIDAIKMTTSDFDLNNYNSFVYSTMEIRILMNIAFVLNKLNHKEIYLEIMEFCINAVDINCEIYTKLCHNLAGAYMRNKSYNKALKHYEMGIRACQESRNPNGLNLLYYGKGIAEYNLQKCQYIESFKTSIYLCEAFGQDNMKTRIVNNCKEIFNINLHTHNT